MNRYFYIDAEGKQKGTFSLEELKQERVRRETLVWTQGMDQWKRADEIAALNPLFSDTFTTTEADPLPEQYPSQSQHNGPQYGSQSYPQMPKTWLVETILVTILPFILCSSFLSLLGIIGIVYAAQVESFYHRGDYAASAEASRAAAKWARIAMWIAVGWVLLIIVSIIFFFLFVGSMAGIGELLNA